MDWNHLPSKNRQEVNSINDVRDPALPYAAGTRIEWISERQHQLITPRDVSVIVSITNAMWF
jgi:hypothetical protein